jgi:hypothetical protein
METVPAQVKGKHVVMTGDDIRGTVVTEDGTKYDVTPGFIEVDSELEAAEVAHAIGLHWADPANVHPSQLDEDGNLHHEFEYDDSHVRAVRAAAKEG